MTFWRNTPCFFTHARHWKSHTQLASMSDASGNVSGLAFQAYWPNGSHSPDRPVQPSCCPWWHPALASPPREPPKWAGQHLYKMQAWVLHMDTSDHTWSFSLAKTHIPRPGYFCPLEVTADVNINMMDRWHHLLQHCDSRWSTATHHQTSGPSIRLWNWDTPTGHWCRLQCTEPGHRYTW